MHTQELSQNRNMELLCFFGFTYSHCLLSDTLFHRKARLKNKFLVFHLPPSPPPQMRPSPACFIFHLFLDLSSMFKKERKNSHCNPLPLLTASPSSSDFSFTLRCVHQNFTAQGLEDDITNSLHTPMHSD